MSPDLLLQADALQQALVEAVEKQAGPERAAQVQAQASRDGYREYGLLTPELRSIQRSFRKAFRELPLAERLNLAERLLQVRVGELSHTAIDLLALSIAELEPSHLELIDHYLDEFNSWGMTDEFCINVLQPLLRKLPNEVLELLEAWNQSDNRWKRRASVVAFTRKVGAGGQFTEQTLRLCENLIWDEDDLVRKAVGWALKDSLRGSPQQVLAYVKDLRSRGVSSVITLYAIRDLKGAERQAVLSIRPEKASK